MIRLPRASEKEEGISFFGLVSSLLRYKEVSFVGSVLISWSLGSS